MNLIGMICIFLLPEKSNAQNTASSINLLQSHHDIQYATGVSFEHPAGMVFDTTGNMYFAAGMTHKIYRVDPSGGITHVAGTGVDDFYGEGVPAIEAHFDVPQKLCFDSSGNLYIVDTYNKRIRKMDSQGIITTVAGNGSEEFLVNGGPATEAAIGNVNSIVFDQTGNMFISSYSGSSILKVDVQGNIEVFAGNGFRGYSGDGGPAIEAELNLPTDIALDRAGNLYIADSFNNRVRKVDRQGIITTVTGNGVQGFQGDGGPAVNASLNYPRGIYVDPDDNLYIAEQNNHCIRKVDASGIITTIAGRGTEGFGDTGFSGDGGLAIHSILSVPIQVTKDGMGNLYIAEVGNMRICKVDQHGVISTVVGTGKSPRRPQNMENNISSEFIHRTTNDMPHSSTNGIIYAAEVPLNHPAGMVFDTTGNMFFATGFTPKIYKMDKKGVLTTIAGAGYEGFFGDGGPALDAHFNLPQKICLDQYGNLFIADTYNARIRKIDTHGIITTIAGTGNPDLVVKNGPAIESHIGNINSIVIDRNSNMYISNYFHSTILKLNSFGNLQIIAGSTVGFSGDGGPAIHASLYRPTDIALDREGKLFIADRSNNCIRMIDREGIISTVAGNRSPGYAGDGGLAIEAQLNHPRGVFVDNENNLYIADQLNHRIRKVDSEGIITTIAGTGNVGEDQGSFSGDGGLAIYAGFNQPIHVSKDPAGNLYIADVLNNRIRKVDTQGIITTVAGNGDTGITTQSSIDDVLSSNTLTTWIHNQYIIPIIVVNLIIIILAVYYYFHLRHTIKIT